MAVGSAADTLPCGTRRHAGAYGSHVNHYPNGTYVCDNHCYDTMCAKDAVDYYTWVSQHTTHAEVTRPDSTPLTPRVSFPRARFKPQPPNAASRSFHALCFELFA